MLAPVTLAMRLLAVAVVPPVAWWTMDRSPAISVDAVEVLTTNVPRGGSLKLRYHINFLRRCSGDGNRFFLDAAHVPIPAASYSFRDGIGRNGQPVPLDNPQWVGVEAVVPGQATPGAAEYQNVTDFFCNPLQRYLRLGIPFAYPLIRFTVTDAPPVLARPPVTAFQPVTHDLDLRDRANLVLKEQQR